MATDRTDVPIARIIGITVLSLGTLVGTRFALMSYFLQNYEGHTQAVSLSRPAAQLNEMRAEAENRLTNIRAGIAAVASGQRHPAIATTPGTQDNAALQGWSLLPRPFTPPPPPAPPPPAPVVQAPAPPAPPAPPAVARPTGAPVARAAGAAGVARPAGAPAVRPAVARPAGAPSPAAPRAPTVPGGAPR